MKLLLAVFLCWILPGAAQVPQARITLSINQESLQSVLDTIEKNSEYHFYYNGKLHDMCRNVSVKADNEPVVSVLKRIFKPPAIEYTIQGHDVILEDPRATQAQSTAVNISGRVEDQYGQPIIGATVIVDKSTAGTTTVADGEFELRGQQLPVTLIVSFIGYQTQSVEVATAAPTKIVLEESAASINEVVVVGYGHQKRMNVTGAVGTISGKDLNNRPVTNAAGALQGADPSLVLTMSNGSVEGKEYSIKIRGSVSLNSGSPLVLVDGVETSLTQVNPNDIESVSVLKDASACSIYGAKASAGVVLITTKSGKSGELKVSYNGRFGVAWNTASTDFLTEGYGYTNFINEFADAKLGYAGWKYTDDEMQMLYDRRNDATENPNRPWVVTNADGKYRYVGNFDWYGYLFKRSRPETEHNVTMTGGNDKVDYYVSGRYLYREGLFNNNAEDIYNGYSFRAKVNAKVTP